MTCLRLPNSEAGPGPGVRQTGGAVSPAVPPVTQLVLPSPPSANALFRHALGRSAPVMTKAYTDWRGHAGWRLRAQRPAPVLGAVIINISVERQSLSADIDNRIKPLLDLLVEHGVIQDDRYVTSVVASWHPGRNAEAHVAIMPAASGLSLRFQLAPDGRNGGWFLDAPTTEGEA